MRRAWTGQPQSWLFSVLDFQKWLYLSGIGRKVRLEIFRNGETLFKDVTVEERPREATTR